MVQIFFALPEAEGPPSVTPAAVSPPPPDLFGWATASLSRFKGLVAATEAALGETPNSLPCRSLLLQCCLVAFSVALVMGLLPDGPAAVNDGRRWIWIRVTLVVPDQTWGVGGESREAPFEESRNNRYEAVTDAFAKKCFKYGPIINITARRMTD